MSEFFREQFIFWLHIGVGIVAAFAALALVAAAVYGVFVAGAICTFWVGEKLTKGRWP